MAAMGRAIACGFWQQCWLARVLQLNHCYLASFMSLACSPESSYFCRHLFHCIHEEWLERGGSPREQFYAYHAGFVLRRPSVLGYSCVILCISVYLLQSLVFLKMLWFIYHVLQLYHLLSNFLDMSGWIWIAGYDLMIIHCPNFNITSKSILFALIPYGLPVLAIV